MTVSLSLATATSYPPWFIKDKTAQSHGVRTINQFAAVPDLTLMVTIDAERAYERVQSRGGVEEIYDELDKQKSIGLGTPALVRAKMLLSLMVTKTLWPLHQIFKKLLRH